MTKGTVQRCLLPCCEMEGCKKRAASHRAKYCVQCFRKQAFQASYRRKVTSGNPLGNPGNKGNRTASGKVGNKGNGAAAGKVGNKGNGTAAGKVGNKGNGTAEGKRRHRSHWQRSAVRRGTKNLLVVRGRSCA